ncbi:hypothetical protein MVEN_02111800 [Mycena venus]|uniref:Uncharacterized protein n=1 Tax=Mycena venus TaxID=2733690 RepID=A0A8H6XA37_9AGAR|nr:hypothetical protein MVEN_02111800 [Mycena venus]
MPKIQKIYQTANTFLSIAVKHPRSKEVVRWHQRIFPLSPIHLLLRCEMLLLLLLVHLLSKNDGAALVLKPLEPRTPNDTCDDINNCRKLFDVIWGCLATFFACTWVSVHPNVPPPGQSWLALFWRRLKMMLMAVVAPEVIVGLAARQFFVARKLSKDFGFSKSHGFLLCMGGFVSSAGYPVTTRKQLKDPELGPQFLASIREVDAGDIMDKSKGDALSKGLALAQGLWFTTQCLARVHQQLAITKLEVTTLAFAVVNVFIWVLWWGKPLDVRRPIVIGPPNVPETGAANVIPHIYKKVWRRFVDNVADAIAGSWNATRYISTSSSSVPHVLVLGGGRNC